MMDSVTRFARALREVGLAAGEPPTRRGYPPSLFAALPRLLERTGNSANGSITALYTVLVEGGDMDEPVADEVRGILDGHVVLSRDLASRNHYPAVDVLQSLSRVMSGIVDPEHLRAASEFRKLLAAYESQRDLVVLGAYKRGSDPLLDRALDRLESMKSFLCQGTDESSGMDETVRMLGEAVI
jgi:FliI/YscN family ATPase